MVRSRISTDVVSRARGELLAVEQLLHEASATSVRLSLLIAEAQRVPDVHVIVPKLTQVTAQETTVEVEALNLDLVTVAHSCSELANRLALVHANVQATEDRLERLFQAVRHGVSQGLSSPTFVQSLRALTSGVDIVTAGVVHGPLGIVWQAFRGKPGPDYTSRVFAHVTGSHNSAGAPLQVRQVSTRAVSAPRSLSEFAERIPEARAGQPQVRIERYGHPEQPTWVVYSAGTVDMSLQAPSEPWDLSSNLNAMATGTSESIKATERAMVLAGINEDAPVIHVGFSQGGLVAAHVALASERAEASLIAFGAPVAHLNFEALNHAVLVEHAEDLVPALGGEHPETDDGRILVTGSLRHSLEFDQLVPAHNMDHYARTLRDAEVASLGSLNRAHTDLLRPLTGNGMMTTWRAER